MKIIIENDDGEQKIYNDLVVASFVLITKNDEVITVNKLNCNIKQAIRVCTTLQKYCNKISRKILIHQALIKT